MTPIDNDIEAFIGRHGLPESFRRTAADFFLPLEKISSQLSEYFCVDPKRSTVIVFSLVTIF